MKKYVDIERLKESYATAFSAGEHIVVTEKIDGANASIRFTPESGTLAAFSRRNELTADNTLQGFHGFVQTLDPAKFAEVLQSDRFIVFGEWLVKHTIHYPESALRQFYVFDVWDTQTEQYVPWVLTHAIADKLGLKTVPVFYDGEFTSWEDLQHLVGRTEMGAEPTGEGIVVKSQDRLDNKSSRTPAYVKIVAEKFSEVHQSKPHVVDPEKLAAKQAVEQLVGTVVTERRVEKVIQKFVEDGLVPEDWDEKSLGAIAKILPKAVFEDCRKEEPDVVAQVDDFGKIAAKFAMAHARKLVK